MQTRYGTPAGGIRESMGRTGQVVYLLVTFFMLMPARSPAADLQPLEVLPRQHADQTFEEFPQRERRVPPLNSTSSQRNRRSGAGPSGGTTDEYLRGIGEGDLAKGRLACQRVAELAARTDLAKQIRVRVTEHAIDRLRERTGRTTEQDLEVVREEMVNELLRDVRIVDKRIDEASGTCISIVAMPRSRIAPDMPAPPPAFPAQEAPR